MIFTLIQNVLILNLTFAFINTESLRLTICFSSTTKYGGFCPHQREQNETFRLNLKMDTKQSQVNKSKQFIH